MPESLMGPVSAISTQSLMCLSKTASSWASEAYPVAVHLHISFLQEENPDNNKAAKAKISKVFFM